MNEGRDGSSKFVFEPQRPKVDRKVLDFVKATVFDPADFTIRSDGVVWLNPQLARHAIMLLFERKGRDAPDIRTLGPAALRRRSYETQG